MLASNLAFNPIKGFKNLGNDLWRTASKKDVPLTHAFRTYEGQQQFANYTGDPSKFKYGAGTLNKKRIAGAIGAAYVGGDMAYRALSGGSMYRNNQGERDFVGIPFL